jgi:uncharacterized protein (DUF1697 family)
VNLGGRRAVAMADLRAFATDLGFDDAQTLLNSGNLLFRCGKQSPASLERLLESEAEARLGLRTDFHVRTPAEWRTLIAANPFVAEAKRDPARLVVVCLKKAPDAKAFGALQAAIKGSEQVRGAGRQAYIYYPEGQGRSKLTTAVIDKALGTTGTARNWNTVTKLGSLLEA